VRQGTGASPEAAAAVAQQSIQCMFNVSADLAVEFKDWPTDNQFDFASSLNPALGGAWYVRGKLSDPTSPAIGNLASLNTSGDKARGNLSVLSPPVVPAGATWNGILAGTRTLIHGEPVKNVDNKIIGYDWKLLLRTVKFTPHAVVALCQGLHPLPGEDFPDASLVHEQDIGFLGSPNIGTLCGTEPVALATLDAQWGRFAFVGQLARAANRLFAPQELAATATVGTTGTGGSVCCAKSSEFTSEEVPAAHLEVSGNSPPSTLKVSTGRFSLAIKVSTPAVAPDVSEPIGGVKVTLTIVNNSGPTHIFEITPAGVTNNYTGCNPADNPASGDPWVVPAEETTLAVVSPDGEEAETIATWPRLCIDKTGTANIIATSVSDGNPNAAQGTISAGTTIVRGQ
jgi:hypothetical protein